MSAIITLRIVYKARGTIEIKPAYSKKIRMFLVPNNIIVV